LSFLGFFCLLVSCVLNCCYFFFFFYSCIASKTTTTTITINNVSEGERKPETNYKLWSSEFRSFGRRKERTTPKLVLLPTLGLGSMYTHTQGLIVVQDLYQVMQPHIHLFSLYMGFEVNIWVVHSYVFLACIHVVNCPCNNSGRRNLKKKKRSNRRKKKILLFYMPLVCYRARGRGCSVMSSLAQSSSVIVAIHSCPPSITVIVYCSLSPSLSIVVRRLWSLSITILFNVRQLSSNVHQRSSIRPFLSTNVRLSSFIPINTLYSSNYMYCIHMYPIPYFSNRMYIFFKIVYRFLKLIHTFTYSCINTYIYIFCINMYIYIIFVLIHTFT